MTNSADTSGILNELNPVDFFEYATESQWRANNYNGLFKRHKTLGHARSARAGCADKNLVTIYRWKYDDNFFDGKWEVIE